jgi:hypothetical protein
MKPKTGGRVVLELVSPGIYRAELYTPAEEWRGDVTVASDGGVTFGAWTPASEPPAWLVKYAHTFLRSAWKDAQKSAEWPQRINRWRDER